MNDLVTLTSQVSMTSKDIADLVGSRHSDVKRSIERLARKGSIQLTSMVFSEKINDLGLSTQQSYYEFTGEQGKRDTIIIAAQIRPEVTAKIVDRWLELEQRNQTPTTYIEALKQLISREEERQALVERTAQLTHQKELAKLETGKSIYGASIKQVNNKTGDSYTWRPLAKWCDENDIEPQTVCLNGYDSLPTKIYPSEAWLDVYELDLDLLFGD